MPTASLGLNGEPAPPASVPTTRTLYTNTQPHSVQISRNAKGEYATEVKVYAADEGEAADRAFELVERLTSRLRELKTKEVQ